MLDFELAEIYGYTTKRFNEQVKNNIERFDEDFRFKLLKEEFDNLRTKKSTSSWGRRKLPKVFAEQGIYKPVFVSAIKEKIGTAIDTENMEKELETLRGQFRQIIQVKN